MAKRKITVPDVFKKDLKVFSYLLVFGVVTYLMDTYVKADPMLSVTVGAAANYALYRIRTELEGEGYREALK